MELYKQIILSHIVDYLKFKKIKYTARGKIISLICPFCNNPAITAQVVAQTHLIKCLNPKCPRKGEKFTLLSIVKKTEKDKANWDNEKIIQSIKDQFKINTLTPKEEEEIKKWFEYYKNNNFSLSPIEKNGKGGIEKVWQSTEHKDPKEWREWIATGLNIGLNCGLSNKTVIDIDQKPIPEEIKELIGNTLIQETRRGFHCIYNDISEFPKTAIGEFIFINKEGKEIILKNPNYKIKIGNEIKIIKKMELKDKGIIKINGEEIEVTLKSYLKIDIETKGGLTVLYPSIAEGISRKFINNNPIIDIPEGFKEYLKSKIKGLVPQKTLSETIKQDIIEENYKCPLIEEGEGRHDLLFHYACILRKQMAMSEVESAIISLNKIVCNPPMDYKEIRNIMNSVLQYDFCDERELANEILDHLKAVEEATHRDIERIIAGDNRLKAEEKARIDKTIAYLKREDLIQQRGNLIFPVRKLDWKTDLIDGVKPLPFKVPYFYDIGYFAWGDVCVIGAHAGSGKTHLAMNIIKQLSVQGIKSRYISLETGSRFKKIALQLGLTENNFYHAFCYDPTKIELEKQAVTIIDWLNPAQFKDTHLTFGHFAQQLDKHSGFLFIFVQLKEDGSFFAPNLINLFPALSVKYLWDKDSEGLSGYYDIYKIRESIRKKRLFKIPCVFNWDTKELIRVDELKENKPISGEEEIIPDGKEEG